MSRKTAIEQLTDLVDEANQLMTEDAGGYPHQSAVVCGHLVIASVADDEGAQLEVYSPEACRQWLADIRRSKREYPDEDVIFHVNENYPKGIVQRS